jgi:hypothetical protein
MSLENLKTLKIPDREAVAIEAVVLHSTVRLISSARN